MLYLGSDMQRMAFSGFVFRRISGSILAASLLLAVGTCTPYSPPPEATIPIIASETRAIIVGLFGLLPVKVYVQGNIEYVDKQFVNRPNALLIPEKLNCVAVKFIGYPFLQDPVILGYAVFPAYPQQGDIVTINPYFVKQDKRIIVTNQHGKVIYRKDISRSSSGIDSEPVFHQSEVTESDIEACRKMMWAKFDPREIW